MSTVTAIIVNYNTGEYAVACVRSLLTQHYRALSIIVVDNASTDGSVALLRSTFGNKIELIESPSNLGFGRANNLAALKVKTDYLLLVNPDAQLLTPDFTSELIAFMVQHPAVGIAGPIIQEPLKRRKIVPPKRHYPFQDRLRDKTFLQHLPGQYAWLLGACLCIRSDLYQKIAGFDPDYFLYGEDTDICLRARKAGFEIGYCEEAKLTHVGGASEVAAIPLDKFLRKQRGRYLFCLKHYSSSDVKRIAYLSLASTYYAACRNKMQRLLRLKSQPLLENDKQKIKATRLVIREVLDRLHLQ